MRTLAWFLLISLIGRSLAHGQEFQALPLRIEADSFPPANRLFIHDPVWRGADGAASIDLGGGRVLWLFSDTFICRDSSGSRKQSTMIRNSLAMQEGYDVDKARLTFHYAQTAANPESFFRLPGKFWFWTGHGIMIRDKLLIFLMKMRGTKKGLGFEAVGWYAVLIDNPRDDPGNWAIHYLEGPDTFGVIAGSSAVLAEEEFIYAFGVTEPATHEVYLLRWSIDKIYRGDISAPEWWIGGAWILRKKKNPVPQPLFTGQTEFSVHFDPGLNKYVQCQSYGFGDAEIGVRTADRLQGPWSASQMIYHPPEARLKDRMMYSVKAHPELTADGLLVSYNINSFNWTELLQNESIYFPRFIRVKMGK